MDIERRILQSILPSWYWDRIDVERHTIETFIKRIASEIPENSLVLDAGSGECRYRPYFAHTRYLTADFAQGENAWDYSGLDMIAEINELPVKTSSADAVVCTQVLEHVPEPGQTLQELHRVLKPSGRLYLTAPQAFGEHQEPYDFFRFTSFGLKHLMKKAGFKIISVEARGGFFKFLSVMLIFFYDRVFPDTHPRILKALLLPFRIPLAFFFLLVLPPLLYAADRLDKRKDITLGYQAIAEKWGVEKWGVPDAGGPIAI